MSTSTLAQSAALALLAAAVLAGCKPAAPAGKADPAAPAAPAAGTLTVQARPDLGEANQAFPRFAGGDQAIVGKINAAMEKLDASAKEGLTGCPEMPHGGQSQTVKVTRNGPDFVVVQQVYESDCGAYPSGGTNDFMFDLKTGNIADFAALIPGAEITYAFHDEDLYSNAFASPVLQARLLEAAKKESDAEWRADCLPVLEQGELSLVANLNDAGGLDVTPDLPHAVQACANPLTLTGADLTALNTDPRLVALAAKK